MRPAVILTLLFVLLIVIIVTDAQRGRRGRGRGRRGRLRSLLGNRRNKLGRRRGSRRGRFRNARHRLGSDVPSSTEVNPNQKAIDLRTRWRKRQQQRRLARTGSKIKADASNAVAANPVNKKRVNPNQKAIDLRTRWRKRQQQRRLARTGSKIKADASNAVAANPVNKKRGMTFRERLAARRLNRNKIQNKSPVTPVTNNSRLAARHTRVRNLIKEKTRKKLLLKKPQQLAQRSSPVSNSKARLNKRIKKQKQLERKRANAAKRKAKRMARKAARVAARAAKRKLAKARKAARRAKKGNMKNKVKHANAVHGNPPDNFGVPAVLSDIHISQGIPHPIDTKLDTSADLHGPALGTDAGDPRTEATLGKHQISKGTPNFVIHDIPTIDLGSVDGHWTHTHRNTPNKNQKHSDAWSNSLPPDGLPANPQPIKDTSGNGMPANPHQTHDVSSIALLANPHSSNDILWPGDTGMSTKPKPGLDIWGNVVSTNPQPTKDTWPGDIAVPAEPHPVQGVSKGDILPKQLQPVKGELPIKSGVPANPQPVTDLLPIDNGTPAEPNPWNDGSLLTNPQPVNDNLKSEQNDSNNSNPFSTDPTPDSWPDMGLPATPVPQDNAWPDNMMPATPQPLQSDTNKPTADQKSTQEKMKIPAAGVWPPPVDAWEPPPSNVWPPPVGAWDGAANAASSSGKNETEKATKTVKTIKDESTPIKKASATDWLKGLLSRS